MSLFLLFLHYPTNPKTKIKGGKMIKPNKFLSHVLFLFFVAAFSTVVIYAYSTGITGQTLKTSSDGCFCHGASNTPSVNVTISGPEYMLPNSTETFTATITGGPLTRAGINIAATSGSLQPLTGSGLQLIGDELTHVSPKSPVAGAVTFQFNYTAPSSLGTQTIYATGNSVNFNGSSSGDQWNWAPNKIVNVSNVIPVELSSFTAQVISNKVILNWSTAAEVNNSGFEIYRSSNSQYAIWDKIGFVNGFGSSTELKNYFFEDKNLQPGIYYYRLKQIDFDGSFKIYNYNGEVSISKPEAFVLNQNFPNPFNPSTTISWQTPISGHQTLKIYDALGNELFTLLDEWKDAGFHTIKFDAAELSSGVYYYQIKSGDFTKTNKMILAK